MRLFCIAVFIALALSACKTASNHYADIEQSANACMAYVVAEHNAGRMTRAQADYGLTKCEQDAKMQAQMRYMTLRRP